MLKSTINKIVLLTLNNMSSSIINELRDFALTIEAKAEATDNPVDDIAAQLIKAALGMDN